MLRELAGWSLALLLIPSALVQQTSKAAADTEAAARMQAALVGAQAIYLWGDLQNCFDVTLSEGQSAALRTGLTAWGRYQMMSALKGSDVILEPTYSSGAAVCVLQVRDSQTLKIIGSFSESRPDPSLAFYDKFDQMSTSLLDDLKALAGKSRTEALPAALPGVPGAQTATTPSNLSDKERARELVREIEMRLTAAHKVLLVDDTMWASGQSAIGKADEFPLFAADMTGWGRYRLVQSVADADLVVMVDDYMHCVRAIVVTGKLAPQCTPEIRLQMYEPASLDFITQVVVEAKTGLARGGKPDPFAVSVQAMTDQFRDAAGDSATKQKK